MLDDLLAYVRDESRLCPMPDPWNRFWQMLPARRTETGSWDPPVPLILAAWSTTPLLAKAARFEQQIRFAADHAMLGAADAYLRALPATAWAGRQG